MPFQYTSNDPDKIVFTRLSAGCSRGVFILVGSIFTFIGICFALLSDSPEMPYPMFRILVPSMGIIAIVVGIKLPAIMRAQTPDWIAFDNTRGRVEIFQQESEVKSAFIYYDEISGFIMKIKKQESSSSSSGKTSSRTYYTYHVYLLKKDGGEWELLRRGSEQGAQEEIDRLTKLVKLDAQPVRETTAVMPSTKYRITDYGHRSEISWRNKLGWGPVALGLFSVFFLAVLYTIVGTIQETGDDMPFFVYGVLGFIGLVFVIVIGGNVLKLVKNANTTYLVSVSDASLEYQERDNGGRIKKSTVFQMPALHAIAFSFDTENTMRKIYIYNHEQFEKKRTLQLKFSIDAIMDVYKFYKELTALDLQDLTAVEALYVETYLQQQVKEKGRTNVA